MVNFLVSFATMNISLNVNVIILWLCLSSHWMNCLAGLPLFLAQPQQRLLHRGSQARLQRRHRRWPRLLRALWHRCQVRQSRRGWSARGSARGSRRGGEGKPRYTNLRSLEVLLQILSIWLKRERLGKIVCFGADIHPSPCNICFLYIHIQEKCNETILAHTHPSNIIWTFPFI